MALQTQDSDVLEALREHSRLFLKLDFAYIAAGGAIITALKIGKSDLIEFGATIDPIVIALVFISLIDVIIFSLVFGSWLSLKIKSVKRTDTRGLETLLKIQPFLHFAFVSFLLIGATSFASGSFDQLTELKHQAELQEAVDSFMQVNGKPPASLKQLKAALPKSVPAKFNDKNVHIVTTGAKSYKLIFPGGDGVFGTTDDDIATQELPLKLVIEALEADGRK